MFALAEACGASNYESLAADDEASWSGVTCIEW